MKLEHFCHINPSEQLCKNIEYDFVEMADIVPGKRYVFSKSKKIFNGSFSKFSNKDTLMAKITPCLENGKISQFIGSDKAFGSTEFNIFREKKDISDNDYLYYLISSPLVKGPAIKSMSGATGRQRANLDKIKQIEVPDISIKAQQKIAKFLSNYDDLIENNNRRIKILEEMAQKIYKEWFVDFKFPGHETSTFKDSPLGKIPNDWEVKKIGKEYKTYLGGTPSRNEIKYWNGDIPWLNSGKTNELRITEASEYITKAGLEKSSTKLMPKFTTVLAITGATLGQVSMLGDEMCANQSVVGVYSNTNQEFVFYLLKDKIKRLIQNASGGAQQHINKDIVNEMEFILPTNNILNNFTNILKPINLEIFNLLHKNRVLKQTRDILLPRLISGEINVENMEVL